MSRNAWNDYKAEIADARAAANPDPHEERWGEGAPQEHEC